MITLNDKIKAYLFVSNINFNSGDYRTGQPEGQPDQILYWSVDKLGQIPTEEQLNESYPIWEGQQIAQKNKQKVMSLLQETDWVELPSVSDTAITPHLVNINEFISYRAALRAIAVNPPTTPAIFPNKPQEQWSDA